MDLPGAISALSDSRDLSGEEMQEVLSIVMQGEATPAQIGAFLTALHIKGESVVELVAAARVMRQFAAVVDVKATKVVDAVGTGGMAPGYSMCRLQRRWWQRHRVRCSRSMVTGRQPEIRGVRTCWRRLGSILPLLRRR